jgi:hypothetical protein
MATAKGVSAMKKETSTKFLCWHIKEKKCSRECPHSKPHRKRKHCHNIVYCRAVGHMITCAPIREENPQ